MKPKASHILGLLGKKHAKDVFVPECKVGATHANNNSVQRLDAWAMKRSWSKPFSFGYEIKISRSDFTRDDKWHGYLDYCTHFSFAVAPGVCEAPELPDGVGLFVMSKSGASMRTIRKPAYRQVQIPEDFYRYVMMCRVAITRDQMDQHRPTREEVMAEWRSWLQGREEGRELGQAVARHISEDRQHAERILARAQEEAAKYEKIKAMLKDAGISTGFDLERRVKDLIDGAIPRSIQRSLMRLQDEIDGVLKTVGERGDP